MGKLLVALLLAASAVSHCAGQGANSAAVAPATQCALSNAPFARQLVSPANGATGVAPSIGTIQVKMVNIPPGAMALVRTIGPVTLSSGSGKTLHSDTLQFSGGSTYSGAIPALAANESYRVTAPDPTDVSQVQTIGCFST